MSQTVSGHILIVGAVSLLMVQTIYHYVSAAANILFSPPARSIFATSLRLAIHILLISNNINVSHRIFLFKLYVVGFKILHLISYCQCSILVHSNVNFLTFPEDSLCICEVQEKGRTPIRHKSMCSISLCRTSGSQ